MSKVLLTNGGVPPNPPAGRIALFTRSSDDRLWYKLSDGTLIGPLDGTGSVSDLQTAYDGGNTIAIPLSGSPVALSNASNANPTLTVTHNFVGAGDAVQVTMSGSSTGNGILSQTSGSGAGFVGISLGTGPAYDANTFNSPAYTAKVEGSGPSARGLSVEFSDPGATGIGIEIFNAGGSFIGQQIAMDATSSGSALVVVHEGSAPAIVSTTESETSFLGLVSANGDGLRVELQSVAATGTGLASQVAGGSATGLQVTMLGTSSGVAASIIHNGSGIGLQIDPGSGDAIRVIGAGPSTLFSVDSVGATSTPQVTFLVPGSSDTITLLGRSGVAGEPLNPRVRLPGAVNIGALGRVWGRYYVPNASPLNLGTDVTTSAQLPTCFTITNNVGPGLVVNLPFASAYHNGDEIRVINASNPGQTIDVTTAAGTQTTWDSFSTAPGTGPFTIAAGTGRRFMAWSPANGGFGSVWVLLTGVL